ncbi:hypothetical protein MHU86_21844 [Fragilaria crotonensis]|nr:hypothetical protein MHU86_21844 [Fragilaria crotonensis]
MSQDEGTERWWILGISLLAVLLLIPILSRVKRSRGRNVLYHGIFVISASALLLLLPDTIQDICFSQAGVLIVGSIIPVYQSIVAVCTFGESDDIEWLQYWIISSLFSYGTEFLDTIADHVPFVAEHWYEIEFFVTLWFVLPWTDGSCLLYDQVTVPFLAPTYRKLKVLMDGRIQMLLVIVNSWYLWVLWITFMTLPEEARRFVTVAAGTVYPVIASTVCITNSSSSKPDHEETFWLTYWCCFSILFIIMDYLETFIGSIPGFYSICLCATVYLFLPMFRGAESVFRNVLVPLTGQYENMLLRDALLVRREMERCVKKGRIRDLRAKVAEMFLMETKEE